MRYAIPIMLVVLLLSACEKNVKNKRLTQKTLEEVKTSSDLSEREKEMIAGYLLRVGLKKAMEGSQAPIILDSGLTIAEVIEKQRDWLVKDSIRVTEEKHLAEEALAAKEAQLAKLRETVLVSLLKKEYNEYEYQDYVTITFAIANKSDKIIKGVKGVLRLEDMFGDPIITLQIKHDSEIAAGKRIITTSSYEYNQFIDEHKKFRFTPLDKIDAKWEPEIIIYNDGTKLEVPNL